MDLLEQITLAPLTKKGEGFVAALHQQEIGAKWIRSEQESVYEIRLRTQCVGFIMITTINPEANLVNVAIEKPLQNLGIGNQAMTLLVKKLKRSEITHLHLEVRQQSPAVRFYRRHGFYETGIRKAYYADGENALLMTKDLFCA